MKKIITSIICFMLIIPFFASCSTTSSTAVIAENIDNCLNKLNIIVNKLDVVDNNYIANPDLYTAHKSTNSLKNVDTFISADSDDQENKSNKNEEINDLLKELIKDKLKEKLQENTANPNCQSGNYLNNRNCDNCYYDPSTNCYICNNSSCPNVNFNQKSCNKLVETISTNTNSSSNNLSDEKNGNVVVIPLTNEPIDDKIVKLSNDSNSTSNPKVLYYYVEENFTPDALRYNPRYVTSYDSDNTSTQLNSYIYKVQKLYAISEDVLEANNTLSNYKANLLSKIDEVKSINNDLKTYSTLPSQQKIYALNNYVQDINTTTKRLRACNGQLNNEIVNISNNSQTGLTTSIDIMNSNYLKILNHIDTRINYHENALATLDQLKYLLQDIISELQENNTDNKIVNIDSYKNNNDISDETNLDNDNLNNNYSINSTQTDIIDDENILNDNNEKTDDYDIDEQYIIEDNNKNNSISNVDTYKSDSTFENETIDNNNNVTENNHTIQDNETLNDANSEMSTQHNYDEQIISNGYNTTEFNNGVNENSVINQNNLNNDNTNNIYYYDNNGNLFNARNNEYLFNSNKNNGNVDTYNYNTLVDIINRGTIDNGINKLSATSEIFKEPVMVNTSDSNNENTLIENEEKLNNPNADISDLTTNETIKMETESMEIQQSDQLNQSNNIKPDDKTVMKETANNLDDKFTINDYKIDNVAKESKITDTKGNLMEPSIEFVEDDLLDSEQESNNEIESSYDIPYDIYS